MKRRNFLTLVTLPLVSAYSWAQKYPSSPSTIIMPLQAGSASDVAIRHMAERLTQKFGQGFAVENVAAAAGLYVDVAWRTQTRTRTQTRAQTRTRGGMKLAHGGANGNVLRS